MTLLRAPFPWAGGKRRPAPVVWQGFGPVRNYVEPCVGSAAVLLARPQPFSGVETVNDKDGFIVNFWRAVKSAPDQVAEFADWPVTELDLRARHRWLVDQAERLQLSAHIEDDVEYFDAKIAGFWLWGQCAWIGPGWCRPPKNGGAHG